MQLTCRAPGPIPVRLLDKPPPPLSRMVAPMPMDFAIGLSCCSYDTEDSANVVEVAEREALALPSGEDMEVVWYSAKCFLCSALRRNRLLEAGLNTSCPV